MWPYPCSFTHDGTMWSDQATPQDSDELFSHYARTTLEFLTCKTTSKQIRDAFSH